MELKKLVWRMRMNNRRRELLQTAIDMLNKVTDIVDTALNQEQDCLDNMPENLQASDRYEKMETTIDCLLDALEDIDQAGVKIVEAVE